MKHSVQFHDIISFHSAASARAALSAALMLITALLAACGASTPTPAVLPTSASTLPPMPTIGPASPTAQPAATTIIDPCKLVPAPDASALAGATFGAGQLEDEVGGGKMCTYGANTTNVFLVEVVQAPDLATAQSQKAQFMAFLQSQLPQAAANGLTITQIPNLADGAILGQANLTAINVNGSALGVVKGTIFFGFSDLVQGGPAPTSQALQDEATKVLGRLP